jgi:hypothetical protein
VRRLLALLLPLALPAAGVDLTVVDLGPDYRPAARPAYLELYATFPTVTPDLLVRRCRLAAGPDGLTCLAARLLYRGASRHDRIARAAEDRVRRAVLRELGDERDPGLLEVYRRLIAREPAIDLLRAALINANHIDADEAGRLAVTLAVAADGAPPGAASPAVRRMALAWLVEVGRTADDGYRRALAHTIGAGDPEEVIAALDLVPAADRGGCAADALHRFLPEHLRGDLAAGRIVRRALMALAPDADATLIMPLLDALPQATPGQLAILANAVYAGRITVPPPAAVHEHLMGRDAVACRDEAIRLLLLRWAPDRLIVVAGEDDPWVKVVRDRQARGE